MRRVHVVARRALCATRSGTPDKTKLAFAEHDLGKDENPTAFTPQAEALRKALKEQGQDGSVAAAAPAKIADHRSLFDSDYTASSADGKSSDKVARGVRSATPDATRVAFAQSVYGKDPNAAAFADQAEAFKKTLGKPAAGEVPKAADDRAMFDSDYTASAGGKTSDQISRSVRSDTPDATRVAFAQTVYGKDPNAAAFADQTDGLSKYLGKPATGPVPKVVDDRAMFDSDYTASSADGKSSETIGRTVRADTPDATRVAFAQTVYGKDPNAAAFASEAAAMQGTLGKPATGPIPKVVDSRAMFDSDYTASSADGKSSDKIGRTVRADTPDATRVAFAQTVYGKDPNAAAFAAKAAAMQGTLGKPATGPVPKVVDDRAMFDSDYTASAGGKTSDQITRTVRADTPDATRVAFAQTVYGKDPNAAAFAAKAAALQGTLGKLATGPVPKVVDDRAMFDSDYIAGAGGKTSDQITRTVRADTPDATRVAFAQTVYGKDPNAAAFAAKAAALQGTLGKPVTGPVPKVVDARAMFDSDYTHSAADGKSSDRIRRHVRTNTPDATRVAFAQTVYGKDLTEPSFAGSTHEMTKTLGRPEAVGPAAKNADHRAMFDSAYSAGSCEKSSDKIRRKVRAATPTASRLAFFDSDHHDDEPTVYKEVVLTAEELAAAAAEVAMARAAARAKSPDHRALFDSDYGHGTTECPSGGGKVRRRKTGSIPVE